MILSDFTTNRDRYLSDLSEFFENIPFGLGLPSFVGMASPSGDLRHVLFALRYLLNENRIVVTCPSIGGCKEKTMFQCPGIWDSDPDEIVQVIFDNFYNPSGNEENEIIAFLYGIGIDVGWVDEKAGRLIFS